MKAVNSRKVIEDLLKSGFENVQHQPVEYPIPQSKFATLMSRLFKQFQGDEHLVIDFSALPRNLLSNLLKQVSLAGTPDSAFPRVKKVWLVYTWAEAYPETAPEFLGEVVGQFTEFSLRRLLADKTHAEVVIFTGGSTYDAYSAMEAAQESRLGNEMNVHLVNFINNENFKQSHLQLRNHYGMMREAQRAGFDIRYVFTTRHALRYMRDVGERAANHRSKGSQTLFVIGAFGPKPLWVAAHFVRLEYLARLQDRSHVECDVLNSKGTQYLSPYSLGSAGATLFAYEPSADDVL